MVIFDCNGVLVDSEMIAASIAAQELTCIGVPVSADLISRFFAGRRIIDMVADIEVATDRRLPADFAAMLSGKITRRLETEVRPTPHAAHALTWLRGPKCVASSSPLERVRISLEATGLMRFFEDHIFSAVQVARGKPAPDLFLHVARCMGIQPADCIVVEDSPAGVTAAHAAGMRPIGFVGGTHVAPNLAGALTVAGAQAIIADMRALKGTVVGLRGW